MPQFSRSEATGEITFERLTRLRMKLHVILIRRLDDGEENNGEGWFIDDVRVSK